jgi:hypothetical protein
MNEVSKELLAIKLSTLVFISTFFCILGSKLNKKSSPIFYGVSKGIKLAFFFAIVGLISLHLYAREIGGYFEMLSTILIYKSGEEIVYTNLSFLKTLSTISSASYLIFLDLARKERSIRAMLLALFCFIVGMISVYIQGGRLAMFLYLIPPFIIFPRWIKNILYVIFPVVILSLFNPERLIFSSDKEGELLTFEIYRSIVSDFSPGMANVYWLNLGDIDSWRWFSDVPFVLLAFLPKRVLGIEFKGESNAIFELVGFPNAADLIGFGILSASVLGVVIWSFVYGYLISTVARCIENLNDLGFYVSAFGLLVYFIFRPMYFSPQHFLFTFLPYMYLFWVANTKLKRFRR